MIQSHSTISKSILSTKKLAPAQLELALGSGIGITHYNALKVTPVEHDLNDVALDHVIITSSNAIPSIIPHLNRVKNCYVVGAKTSKQLRDLGCQVIHISPNGKALARYIMDHHSQDAFTYITGVHRRDELPQALQTSQINFKEVKVYDTQMVMRSYDRIFDAVLCYSPRGVYAFAKANPKQLHHAICIGETTAITARKFAVKVTVATKATIENTLVTAIKALQND